MKNKPEQYVPALGYAPLTRFYDLVVGLTTREAIFKNALLDQAPLSNESRVLDVACGTGTLVLMIKSRFPLAEVTGIDGDPTILELARRKIEKAAVSIQLDCGLSYEMPYDENQFDVVVSSLFFHHLDYAAKERTAREIYRVLHPQGEVHIVDWGKPDNSLMALLFYGVQLLDGFENTNDNRKGQIPTILAGAGFREVATSQSFSTIFGTLALYRGQK